MKLITGGHGLCQTGQRCKGARDTGDLTYPEKWFNNKGELLRIDHMDTAGG